MSYASMQKELHKQKFGFCCQPTDHTGPSYNASCMKSGRWYATILTDDWSYGLSLWNGPIDTPLNPGTDYDWSTLYAAIGHPSMATDRCLGTEDILRQTHTLHLKAIKDASTDATDTVVAI